MAVDVDAIKARVRIEDVVRTALGELKREGRKLVACCPFHEEKTASFKVDVEEQFYKCFGCGAGGDVLDFVQKFYKCDFNAAVEKLGGAPAAGHVASKPTPPPRLALPAPAKPKTFFPTLEKLDAAAAYTASGKGGKVVARHDYPGGLFVYRIVLPLKDGDKKRKKMFLQGHSDQGGFVWGGVPISQPYHAEKLKDTPVVVLVEGEQKVEKLEALGFPATCNAGGSSAPTKTDWRPLAGKTILFWRDFDAPGEQHQAVTLALLQALHPHPQIKIVPVEGIGLKPGGDVVDFAGQYLMDEDASGAVKCVLQCALEIGPLAVFEKETNDTIMGLRAAIDFPWPHLSEITLALMPGTLTILAGPAGNTKSIMLLYAFMHWLTNGVRGALLELEDGVSFHLRRAQALHLGNSNLTNVRWVKQNPEKVQEAFLSSRDFLHGLSACICALPRSTPATVANILAWVRTQAVNGARVIAIDPVTDAIFGKDMWSEDRKYVSELNALAEEFQVSIIAVTHPRKFAPAIEKVTLDDLASTAAWGRSCQTALWLGYHETQEEFVKTSMGKVVSKFNRTLRILKARNSGSRDIKLAMNFNPYTLRMEEIGELTE